MTFVDSIFCYHRHLARCMKVQFKVCAELSVECHVKGKGRLSLCALRRCMGEWRYRATQCKPQH